MAMIKAGSFKEGFSLIEILVAMIFVSMAFLPIYNLFRFGSQGTVNNVYEITANNYASDMVNFVRDLKTADIKKAAGNNKKIKLNNDSDITSFFKRSGLVPPGETAHPFVRSMTLEAFKGSDEAGPVGIIGWMRDILFKRRMVENYLVMVRVEFPRKTGGGNDDVTLFTMVMD